jgi:predicted DNA-binding protein YlxM (UPF0122 family)
MYNKIVQIALLYDFYGQLLTDKQIEAVDMYYNNDLSLGEISEQLGISRQGVYDTLKRAERTLFEYEEKLGLLERFTEQKQKIEQITQMLDEMLKNNDLDKEYMIEKLTEIKKYVDSISKVFL